MANTDPYDVVILGSGPGGYVAALRAAQLGLHTAIVEREYVGGVCLNVGCIPSKALLRGADLLTTLKHADDFGIVVDNLHTDYAQAVARSRQVVGRLTKGVEFLLRRAKVDLVRGAGRLAARDRVVVTTEGRGARVDHPQRGHCNRRAAAGLSRDGD